MSDPTPDRFIISANAHTAGVVIKMGDVEVTVKMPTPPGSADLSEEQLRRTVLRQVRRVLEVARQELD
jgi:hypothetical protein